MAASPYFLLLLIALFAAPIISPGISAAPFASEDDITKLLEKAGCKTVAGLLQSTGVLKTFLLVVDKGLTVFAPNDDAFKAKGVLEALGKLSSVDKVSLLLYHVVPSYKPLGSLKANKSPICTLASNGTKKFELTTTTAGDDVILNTGVNSPKLIDTVLDASPVVIFSIDNVLLPEELFGKSPSPAPSPAPSASEDDITKLLEKAGCKTVAGLLQSTGVLKTFLSVAEKGLTVFAPNDDAFKAMGVLEALGKLSSADKVSLLLYHAVPSYKPLDSLKANKSTICTLASNGTKKFELTTTTAGDDVILNTGVDSPKLIDTVLDASPVVIFSIDNVLLPEELFGKSPSPAPSPAPSASEDDITKLLEKAGCKTVAGLLQSTGVLKTFLSVADKGLTVFAPNDDAFKAMGVLEALGKLSNADKVSLLLYHAVPSYKPLGSLKANKSPISTLASNGTKKFELTTTTAGDDVILNTGVDSPKLIDTVLNANPVVIFSIDNVLLPEELFGKSPSPAPTPEPATPSPAPSASNANITLLLEKAGCKTVAGLLQSTGVLKTFLSVADKGLTVFAPNDDAFNAAGVLDALKKLSNADTVSLLLYHAVPSYKPLANLKANKSPIWTLASNDTKKFELTTTTTDDDVTLNTGVDSSKVIDTILDATPVVIFSVDNVLLPEEIFGKSPSPAPAPAASWEAPSPFAGMPGVSPATAPSGEWGGSTAGTAAVHVPKGVGFLTALIAVTAILVGPILIA